MYDLILAATEPTNPSLKWALFLVAGLFYLFFGTGQAGDTHPRTLKEYGSIKTNDQGARNNATSLMSHRPDNEKDHTYIEDKDPNDGLFIQVTTTDDKGVKRFWEWWHEDNFNNQ